MVAQIAFLGAWNSDYWSYSLCDTQKVNVLSNNYKTIEFNFSLNGHYYQAFHQLDAMLFNMSDQQTVVCIVISFVLMSLFVIIGFKQHRDSDNNDNDKVITWIDSVFLLYCCLGVITLVTCYFFKIYVIGLGCSGEENVSNIATNTLPSQFALASISLTSLLIPQILDLFYILWQVLNNNKNNSNNPSDDKNRLQACFICVGYEKICNGCNARFDNKFAWNLWLLTPTMIIGTLFAASQDGDALLGVIESIMQPECSYGSDSCSWIYYKDIHRLIVSAYGVILVSSLFFFMIWIESRIPDMGGCHGCKCYFCLLLLELGCMIIGVLCAIINVSEFPNVSWYGRMSPIRRKQQENINDTFRICLYVCEIIYVIRALSMILGCVISKYCFIGWYLILTAVYLYTVILSTYVTYAPLFIIGIFIIVLIFFHQFNCNINVKENNSNDKENSQSKHQHNKIVVVIISIFLQLLDLTTDYNLIYQWVFVNPSMEFDIYAAIIFAILFSSQIVSMYKMGNVDEILIPHDYNSMGKNNSNNNNKNAIATDEIVKNVNFSCCDKLMTCIGCGRSWVAGKLIKMRHTYYGEYVNLKIYELCLESIPSVILQLYIALVQAFIIAETNGNSSLLTLVASIIVTINSASFSIWRIFASNAHSNDDDDTSRRASIVHPISNKPNVSSVELECMNDKSSRGGIINEDASDQKRLMERDDSTSTHSTTSVAEANANTISDGSANDEKKSEINSTDTNESAREIKQAKYSKFSLFIIYVLICSDLYIRSFPFIFGTFVIRLALEHKHGHYSSENWLYMWICIAVMVVGVVVIGIYEYTMLMVIKKDKYKTTNGWTRIQQSFMSYFTCLLSLLFTLPLKHFHQKNIFDKYVHVVTVKMQRCVFSSNTFWFPSNDLY